jgi:hypothetical protein
VNEHRCSAIVDPVNPDLGYIRTLYRNSGLINRPAKNPPQPALDAQESLVAHGPLPTPSAVNGAMARPISPRFRTVHSPQNLPDTSSGTVGHPPPSSSLPDPPSQAPARSPVESNIAPLSPLTTSTALSPLSAAPLSAVQSPADEADEQECLNILAPESKSDVQVRFPSSSDLC